MSQEISNKTEQEYVARVLVSDKAKEVIDELRDIHGELMFHQSGGCCDGSSPMCYPADEFKVGDSDIYLGDIHDCRFYISRDQFEYWKHTQLTIDVTQGRGSSFSLEIPMGLRFIIRSRLFSDEELQRLFPVQ
jgi:uncharacterized protein (DUF779 family)